MKEFPPLGLHRAEGASPPAAGRASADESAPLRELGVFLESLVVRIPMNTPPLCS